MSMEALGGVIVYLFICLRRSFGSLQLLFPVILVVEKQLVIVAALSKKNFHATTRAAFDGSRAQ
jgi:UDP-N-acetylmuramyl pentapeptide phosphotransferase/UDP-N-acetylglucosamine-1-phosphate transferase